MCEFDAVDLKDFEKPDKSISLEKFIHKGDAGGPVNYLDL